ncbi:MAG: hypothetical protein HRT74_01810 [Flavobacteriales bacterium]|nr:hypothetical protein [Flavobacteriales bacterium]
MSIHTDDWVWRTCFIPPSCGQSFVNGVAWGDLDNDGESVSIRAQSGEPGLILHVFSKETFTGDSGDLTCVGEASLVTENSGTFIYEVSFDLEEGLDYLYCVSFDGGDENYATFPSTEPSISMFGCLVPDCLDPNACNYNPNAFGFVQTCVYPSCADPEAANFDITGGCSDSSCAYVDSVDFDGDGEVGTSDLLIFLSGFGCQIDCTTDLNSDGVVGGADLLSFCLCLQLINL